MEYGTVVPKGALPVYSCKTEAEAKQLLVAACPRSINGDFVAVELVEEQTTENLRKFSDRLAIVAQRLKGAKRGR